MNIASYLRNLELLVPATTSEPFEWENAHPFNVIENVELTEESGPEGYALFLAAKYAEMHDATFVQAQELRRGMVIVERDARGKKRKSPVADAYRIGEHGHGHIVVSVARQLWRYEPESLVEID